MTAPTTPDTEGPTVSWINLRGQQGEPAGMMTVSAGLSDGSEVVLIQDNGNVISHSKNVRDLFAKATTTPDTEETVSLADLRPGDEGVEARPFTVIEAADHAGDVKVQLADGSIDWLWACDAKYSPTITRKPRPLAVGDRVTMEKHRGEVLDIKDSWAWVIWDGDPQPETWHRDRLTREAAQ